MLCYASAITEQKKYWELLAEKFDRFQTLRNNSQQHATGYANGATCNIQQCWELLVNNVASVCTQPKKDGCEYEPDNLRVMLASLDQHLREKDAAFSIAKDIEFSNSRKVLEGKARLLRQEGFGKRPNAAKALTSQDEELLWSKGVLGSHSPQSLIQTRGGSNSIP